MMCFRPTLKKLKTFLMIGCHIRPKKTITKMELDNLARVTMEATAKTSINNTMTLGDFNIGKKFITTNEIETLLFNTNPAFNWILTQNKLKKISSSVHTKEPNLYDR